MDHLRAGIAVYNAGHYHAAHDAWEERYLEIEGTQRDFYQGLIQHTAAIHHARHRNWAGATGLADSALGYLDGVDDRGVNLADVRAWLSILCDDPEVIQRRRPPVLTHRGKPVGLRDLQFPAAGIAARMVAEGAGYDENLLAQAVGYAEADLADEEVGSPFVSLVLDFVRGDQRGIVVQRLGEHVRRRQAREDDVSGLFDEESTAVDDET
jgi:hypothetical protein